MLDSQIESEELEESGDLDKAINLIEEIGQLIDNLGNQECVACSGSGYYDNDQSPKCGECSGYGKTVTGVSSMYSLESRLWDLGAYDSLEEITLAEKLEARMKTLGINWTYEI